MRRKCVMVLRRGAAGYDGGGWKDFIAIYVSDNRIVNSVLVMAEAAIARAKAGDKTIAFVDLTGNRTENE